MDAYLPTGTLFPSAAFPAAVIIFIFSVEALILLPFWGLPLLQLLLQFLVKLACLFPEIVRVLAAPSTITRALAFRFRWAYAEYINWASPPPPPRTARRRREAFLRERLSPEEFAKWRASPPPPLPQREQESPPILSPYNSEKKPFFAAWPSSPVRPAPPRVRPPPRHPSEQEVKDMLAAHRQRKADIAAWDMRRKESFEKERAFWKQFAAEQKAAEEAAYLAANPPFSHDKHMAASERFFAIGREPGNGSLMETLFAPPCPCPPGFVRSPLFPDVPIVPTVPIIPGVSSREMAAPAAQAPAPAPASATAAAPPPPPPPPQQQQQQQQPPPAAPAPVFAPSRPSAPPQPLPGSGAMAGSAPVRPAIAVQPTGGAPQPSAPSNPPSAAVRKRSADNPLFARPPAVARQEFATWYSKVRTGLGELERWHRNCSPKEAWANFCRTDQGRTWLRTVTRSMGWVVEWAVDPNTGVRDEGKFSQTHMEIAGLTGPTWPKLVDELKKGAAIRPSDEKIARALELVVRVEEVLMR